VTPDQAKAAREERIRHAAGGIYRRMEAEALKEATRKAQPRKVPAQPTEYQEQVELVRWLMLNRIDFAANGEGAYFGADGAVRGAIQRRAGAQKGRPDLEVYTAPPRFPAARGWPWSSSLHDRGRGPRWSSCISRDAFA